MGYSSFYLLLYDLEFTTRPTVGNSSDTDIHVIDSIHTVHCLNIMLLTLPTERLRTALTWQLELLRFFADVRHSTL